MPVETLRDIIRHGTETCGAEAAFRYKVKGEIVNRSYQGVNRDSIPVSRIVESMGMSGKHIILVGTITYQWIVGYFGTMDNGSVAVPIDIQLPADVVHGLLDRVDTEVLIFDEIRQDVAEVVREKYPCVRQVVPMQAAKPGDEIRSLSMQVTIRIGEYETAISPSQVCTILFASGTAGKNKGVVFGHRNLVDSTVYLDTKIPAGTISMTLLPTSHVYCLTIDIIKGLYIEFVICTNDSIVHVQKNMKLFKPEIVLLTSLVIESIYGKPRDADNLMSKGMVAKAVFGGNLRIIYSGGAYPDPDYAERFKEYGITVLQGYDTIECSPVINTNLKWDHKTSPADKLLPNYEAKIADEEIRVRGTNVVQGYYKMQEEADQALKSGWFKTGDLGYVDKDSFLYTTGYRRNLVIPPSGENVSPKELENQLSRSDLVKEVLVKEKDKVTEAEIFPDYEYARKKHVKDIEGGFREFIDEFNKGIPVYKRIYSLIVREAELEKTPFKKIERF